MYHSKARLSRGWRYLCRSDDGRLYYFRTERGDSVVAEAFVGKGPVLYPVPANVQYSETGHVAHVTVGEDSFRLDSFELELDALFGPPTKSWSLWRKLRYWLTYRSSVKPQHSRRKRLHRLDPAQYVFLPDGDRLVINPMPQGMVRAA